AIQRTPMTRPGYERLKEELERLKRVERHAISRAIAEARAHGDLSENAEYHAAREKQAFTEARINELEAKVGNAEVLDPPSAGAVGQLVLPAAVGLGPRVLEAVGPGLHRLADRVEIVGFALEVARAGDHVGGDPDEGAERGAGLDRVFPPGPRGGEDAGHRLH